MQYIKYFWKYIDEATPVLIFAELDEERYSTRCVEVFPNRNIEILGENEEYVSESPYPLNKEIDAMDEFRAFNISKGEFEEIWSSYPHKFCGNLEFSHCRYGD